LKSNMIAAHIYQGAQIACHRHANWGSGQIGKVAVLVLLFVSAIAMCRNPITSVVLHAMEPFQNQSDAMRKTVPRAEATSRMWIASLVLGACGLDATVITRWSRNFVEGQSMYILWVVGEDAMAVSMRQQHARSHQVTPTASSALGALGRCVVDPAMVGIKQEDELS
jgi:hypothetical protein